MSVTAVSVSAGHDRELTGCLAIPAAGNGPGLLVLFDGGREAAPGLADLYAAEGYVALCLAAPGMDHDGLAAALAALCDRAECTGKIAALGFGPGVVAALGAAVDKPIEAVIGYGPIDPEPVLDLASRAACPMLLHLADSDAPPSGWVERLTQVAGARPGSSVHLYPGVASAFGRRRGDGRERAAAGLAHSRSMALLRRVLGPRYDLETLWEAHTRYEFETRDVAATMATMVAEPYVNHVPVMTGGVGHDDLARFYANHFIPKCPADIAMVPVSRTIGADRIVDEMVISFTHDVEIDWMLPGVAPTGRRVEVPLVAIVGFRGDRLYHEHIYWDQASVLVQIGLLDPKGLPVAGAETARKLLDATLPSNTLMQRWAESAPAAD
jgi:carboxymethylenebutenolidase